jgi:serine/threonine protein phosphatase 1
MFFRRAAKAREAEICTARLPEGQRVYAVGDVHGRADLLARLADLVAVDLAERPAAQALAVFLGDYVDRGRDSAGVLDRLAAGQFPTPMISLRGNHEETFLEFLQNPEILESWRHYGGVETLVSYGVSARDIMRGRGYDAARVALWEALPPAHLDFLNGTLLSWSAGDYFFAHAGVRPQVPLERQNAHDLLWIREEFLNYRGSFDDKVVVHGHTPMPEAELLHNRINVDTGAYATGVLTCVVLEADARRLIHT